MKADQEVKEIRKNVLIDHAEMAYKNFCAHRAIHGCRGSLCEEGKRLRAIWAETDGLAEKQSNSIKDLIELYGEVFICGWCDRVYLKAGSCKCGQPEISRLTQEER